MGNKSHNLTYCSLLQAAVVHSFRKIKSAFPVPFWDYVADCWWLHGMVSICLIRKGSLLRLIPHWRASHLLANFSSISAAIHLLFKIFCQDNNVFCLKSISLFPIFVCPEKFQSFCYCKCDLNFTAFHKFFTKET